MKALTISTVNTHTRAHTCFKSEVTERQRSIPQVRVFLFLSTTGRAAPSLDTSYPAGKRHPHSGVAVAVGAGVSRQLLRQFTANVSELTDGLGGRGGGGSRSAADSRSLISASGRNAHK